MNDFALQLNIPLITEDYIKAMTTVANRIAQEMLDEMRQELQISWTEGQVGRGYGSNVTHNNEIKEADPKKILDGIISTTIYNYGWAIIASYGTGRQSSAPDVYKNAYRSSPLWNSLRTSFDKVVGRNSGSYDGVISGTSTGEHAGKATGGGFKGNGAIQDTENVYFKVSYEINNRVKEASDGFFKSIMLNPKYWTQQSV